MDKNMTLFIKLSVKCSDIYIFKDTNLLGTIVWAPFLYSNCYTIKTNNFKSTLQCNVPDGDLSSPFSRLPSLSRGDFGADDFLLLFDRPPVPTS